MRCAAAWPDPDDEARGDGARVRPPVTPIADGAPRWVASVAPWGASRARWWIPGEASSPPGPAFQADGRWRSPAAYHAAARPCAAGPPGHPWWLWAGLGAALAAVVAAATMLSRRRARA